MRVYEIDFGCPICGESVCATDGRLDIDDRGYLRGEVGSRCIFCQAELGPVGEIRLERDPSGGWRFSSESRGSRPAPIMVAITLRPDRDGRA